MKVRVKKTPHQSQPQQAMQMPQQGQPMQQPQQGQEMAQEGQDGQQPSYSRGGNYAGQTAKPYFALDIGKRPIDPGFPRPNPFGYNNTISEVPRDQATLEAEAKESLVRKMPDGSIAKFDIGGKPHSKGGTPLEGKPGDFIFSQTKKMAIGGPILELFGKNGSRDKKYTPAQLAKQYDINKFQSILADPNSDQLQKKTAEMMIAKYGGKLQELAEVQEAKKGNPQGAPDIEAEQSQMMAKYGGYYQMGGELPIAQDDYYKPFPFKNVDTEPLPTQSDIYNMHNANKPLVPYSDIFGEDKYKELAAASKPYSVPDTSNGSILNHSEDDYINQFPFSEGDINKPKISKYEYVMPSGANNSKSYVAFNLPHANAQGFNSGIDPKTGKQKYPLTTEGQQQWQRDQNPGYPYKYGVDGHNGRDTWNWQNPQHYTDPSDLWNIPANQGRVSDNPPNGTANSPFSTTSTEQDSVNTTPPDLPWGYRNQDQFAMATAFGERYKVPRANIQMPVLPQFTKSPLVDNSAELAAIQSGANARDKYASLSMDGNRARANFLGDAGQQMQGVAQSFSNMNKENTGILARDNERADQIFNNYGQQSAQARTQQSEMNRQQQAEENTVANHYMQNLQKSYAQATDNAQKMQILNKIFQAQGYGINPRNGRLNFKPAYYANSGSGQRSYGQELAMHYKDIAENNPKWTHEQIASAAEKAVNQSRFRTQTKKGMPGTETRSGNQYGAEAQDPYEMLMSILNQTQPS